MNKKISKLFVGLAQIEHLNGPVEEDVETPKLPHFDWLIRGNVLIYVESYLGYKIYLASYASAYRVL